MSKKYVLIIKQNSTVFIFTHIKYKKTAATHKNKYQFHKNSPPPQKKTVRAAERQISPL